MHPEDLRGQLFGRLTPEKYVGSDTRGTLWRCLCTCGNYCIVAAARLKMGKAKSCGCLRAEVARAKATKHGHARYAAGARTGEYVIWMNMKQRCTNHNNRQYNDYGGRGIKVCKRWMNFGKFISDMGPRPTGKHTIERKDNDKGYTPTNCIWLSQALQSRNRRTSRRIEHNGITATLAGWGERTGLTSRCIRRRIEVGWSIARALSEPLNISKAPFRLGATV